MNSLLLSSSAIYSPNIQVYSISLHYGALRSALDTGYWIVARSAIYVHRRSLLSVPTTPPPTPTTPPGFPKVIGLTIIGETVACTLRVIFSGDFKVPKKTEKKSAFSPLLGSQATARLTPILDTLLGTFLSFFEKSAFTIPSQNGPFLPDLVLLVISAFTIPSQNDSFLPDLIILPGRPTLRCAPPAPQVLSSRCTKTAPQARFFVMVY